MRRNQLAIVKDWTEKAVEAKYDPARLAVALGVSLRTLERFFDDRTSRPPRQWLDEVRLWRALRRLSEGSTVSAVVRELRFYDHSHLYHEFRRYFGCGPGDVVNGLAPPSVALGPGTPTGVGSPEICAKKLEELEARLASNPETGAMLPGPPAACRSTTHKQRGMPLHYTRSSSALPTVTGEPAGRMWARAQAGERGPPGDQRTNALTARQAQILRLIAKGLPDKHIARDIGISEETVAYHLRLMFQRHGVLSRAALVAMLAHPASKA
jgi:AraC-like DNA-binding protein